MRLGKLKCEVSVANAGASHLFSDGVVRDE